MSKNEVKASILKPLYILYAKTIYKYNNRYFAKVKRIEKSLTTHRDRDKIQGRVNVKY